MSELTNLLAPFSSILCALACSATGLVFLLGFTQLDKIRRVHSSKKYSVDPFVCSTLVAGLNLLLSKRTNNHTMMKVNSLGVACNIISLAFYYFYAPVSSKVRITLKITSATFLLGLCVIYSQWEEPENVEFRLSMLISGILVIMLIHRMLNVDAANGQCPGEIVTSTSITFIWILYSISMGKYVKVYQSLVLILFDVIQLLIIWKYKSQMVANANSGGNKRANRNTNNIGSNNNRKNRNTNNKIYGEKVSRKNSIQTSASFLHKAFNMSGIFSTESSSNLSLSYTLQLRSSFH